MIPTVVNPDELAQIGLRCAALAQEAIEKHGYFNSAHETYAVIAEELDEYWDLVKQHRAARSPQRLVDELEDIAAACIKALHQLSNTPTTP